MNFFSLVHIHSSSLFAYLEHMHIAAEKMCQVPEKTPWFGSPTEPRCSVVIRHDARIFPRKTAATSGCAKVYCCSTLHCAVLSCVLRRNSAYDDTDTARVMSFAVHLAKSCEAGVLCAYGLEQLFLSWSTPVLDLHFCWTLASITFPQLLRPRLWLPSLHLHQRTHHVVSSSTSGSSMRLLLDILSLLRVYILGYTAVEQRRPPSSVGWRPSFLSFVIV